MTNSKLEKLFKNICCYKPAKKAINNLKKYPNQKELSSFLVEKLKAFLKVVNSTDIWDSDLEYGIAHSCRILGGELKSTEACKPMIALMDKVKDNWEANIYDSIMIGMKGMGEPALELVYEKYQADKEYPELASTWIWILAQLGVKDERINQALLEHLKNDPDEAMLLMGYYGDKSFLPIIESYVENIAEYLNEIKIDAFSGIRYEEPFVGSYLNLRESLVILKEGIQPSHPEFDKKVEEIDRKLLKHTDFSIFDEPIIIPNLKVGRNEPCPCGSGKKYKKCCLIN